MQQLTAMISSSNIMAPHFRQREQVVMVTDMAALLVFSSASAPAREYRVSNCSVMSAARWVWPELGAARAFSPHK